jgi:hypothetical protein
MLYMWLSSLIVFKVTEADGNILIWVFLVDTCVVPPFVANVFLKLAEDELKDDSRCYCW